MAQYRKKPVVIEAVQLTATLTGGELDAFLGTDKPKTIQVGDVLIINTLEGYTNAKIGDWLIRGVRGDLYPCKSDLFELTYEEVR